MTDTVRSQYELMTTTFADLPVVVNRITPQNARDLIASIPTIAGGFVNVTEKRFGNGGAKLDGNTDDTAALMDARAAAEALGDGAKVIVPPQGKLLFNSQWAPTKAIVLEGSVGGIDNTGQHSGPTLIWNGGATSVFSFSGAAATNAQLHGFLLDNKGSATIGVSVETGGVGLKDFAIVSPTVPFSTNGLAISPSGSNTSPNVKLDNVICRGAAPINLKVGRIAGFLPIWRGSFMDPSSGGTVSVQLGDAVAATEARYIHFFYTSFESTTTGLVNVQISRARQATFEECYFEISGANAVAVDIPSSATVAFGVHLDTCRLGAIAGSPYAIRSNFASAILSAHNNTLDGTFTGMFNNTLCRHATLSENKYNGSGLVWASSLKGVSKWENEQSGSVKVRDDGYFVERDSTSVSSVGNTLAAETDLTSATLSANRLYENDMVARITTWGTTAANGNGKQIKLYVGGTVVLDSTSLAANNKPWSVKATAIRDSATTAIVTAEGQFNGAVIQTAHTSVTVASTGWDAAQIIKMTGTGAATNDILQKGMLVEVSN